MCGCSYLTLFIGNLFTTLRVVYQKYVNNADKPKKAWARRNQNGPPTWPLRTKQKPWQSSEELNLGHDVCSKGEKKNELNKKDVKLKNMLKTAFQTQCLSFVFPVSVFFFSLEQTFWPPFNSIEFLCPRGPFTHFAARMWFEVPAFHVCLNWNQINYYYIDYSLKKNQAVSSQLSFSCSRNDRPFQRLWKFEGMGSFE